MRKRETKAKGRVIFAGSDGASAGEAGQSRQLRMYKDIRWPTKDEWEQHQITHKPYKEWCSFCVQGRGRACRHQRTTNDEEQAAGTMPEISVDYCFPSEKRIREQ